MDQTGQVRKESSNGRKLTLASEDSESLTNCGYDDGTVRDVTRRAYSSRT
ncbi:hypothetical protein Hdeb2414_s0088g00786371 [Helianthus debilis subsp. tardiflorus]|nr:hypothetical protein HanIR_Chr03g0108471 [Helianthus annuus]KAJ0614525.1 hypothetical protein HanIR_Chr02g0063421 [Helianthus annuus]